MAINGFRQVTNGTDHLLLGPRTAFLIGSTREDGSPHLCAASNVTDISIEPQIMVVALSPKWETVANIRRTSQLTINLMDSSRTGDIWIVGNKYSGVELSPYDNKFDMGGLTPVRGSLGVAGVGEALAFLECEVVRIVEDITDHVVFFARSVGAYFRPEHFNDDNIIDVSKVHPPMQIRKSFFAQCEPCASPDTEECSRIAAERRRALQS